MPVLDREEYIEQAYFFQAFRERLIDGMPAQEILSRIGEELLSTTKLPMAISFLATEIKASGVIAPSMSLMSHYFAPFQAFVIARGENETSKFPFDQALLILEREAKYKSESVTSAGLFIYQFETISRNRLGYNDGLESMANDPHFNDDWREYIERLRDRLGDVDFADLIYVRSAYFVAERRRLDAEFLPKFPTLFSEKEGKIARAHRGRDPMYLFKALQRQVGYPEIPRPHRPDAIEDRVAALELRIAQLENRIKLAEGDLHNDFDPTEVLVKPEDTAGVPKGWGRSGDDSNNFDN